MDRERLTRLLEEPGRVAREDLSDLKALAERYPWFSGAQLLRVAGEQAAGDVLFDRTLHSAAAHLPSRAVLFDLVEQKGSTPVPQRPEPRILRLPVPEAPPAKVQVEAIAESGPSSAEVSPVVVEETIPTQRLADEPEVAPAVDPLERQILEAALASAYDLTWKEEAKGPAETAREDTRVIKEVLPPTSPLPVTRGETVPIAPLSPSERKAVAPDSKLRFTAWLDMAGPVAGAAPPSIGSSTTPPDAQDWLRGTPPEAAEQPPLSDARDLIDRFIQQQTPEPVRKTEFFTPQQAAKRSLDDTAGLVTETLARIYEKQGNLPKAIEAYHKLALKYPHKSDYFAALQKSLEEQLNK